jgi:hypothetical protein
MRLKEVWGSAIVMVDFSSRPDEHAVAGSQVTVSTLTKLTLFVPVIFYLQRQEISEFYLQLQNISKLLFATPKHSKASICNFDTAETFFMPPIYITLDEL